MPKASDVGRELLYPATHATVLIALVSFFLLLEFAAFGRILGLFLAFLVLPALMRYLMLLLEARARGGDPGAPGIELFMWFDNAWTLFPVVHGLVLVYATYVLDGLLPSGFVLLIDLVLVAVIPASLAVLALTRSPLQSLRPGAVLGVIMRCGAVYWIAPAFLMLATMLVWWLSTLPVIDFVLEFIGFYLLFACFALIGGLIRPYELEREIDIPPPLEPDAEKLDERLEQQRRRVLNHAYGFLSRGNRAGGLEHIYAWLAEDPAPDSAWAWFTEEMLRWEIKEQALPFAQQYLSRLLRHGEQVKAVKLMLRCRLVNGAFGPLAKDRQLALRAAEACQNDELISLLQ